jgi:hypothetical protein
LDRELIDKKDTLYAPVGQRDRFLVPASFVAGLRKWCTVSKKYIYLFGIYST